MAPDIRPDRNNWRQFTTEPPLSSEEAAEWQAMAKAIREAEAQALANLSISSTLFDFIFAATSEEYEVLRAVEGAARTSDWADLVATADAGRRLKRAEIAAWERWKSRLSYTKEAKS
jgi:alpha-ketoglutarate-dependent taurine dioxygenase